jgi:hypothetical protein
MGLVASSLRAIAPHARGARILSLGYPDLVAAPSQIREALGATPAPATLTDYPETLETFASIGATMRVIDIVRARGVEEIVDLNLPQALGEYDLVLDAGTLEHCFNPGQALLNAAAAVRQGGHIFHAPPLVMMNHGFYNICPTLLHDFYSQNGWEILLMQGLQDKGRGLPVAISPAARFAPPASECVLHVLARRWSDAPLRIPRQSKYQ